MRKNTFLKMMFVAIALVIGSVNVWGQVSIVAGNSINQDFNIGGSATANLPTGWKADKLTTARTLGTYASAVSATERSDGNSMSATAGNGIYNFGAGVAASATDRAVGGLSSGSASKSVNIYVQLTNNGVSAINNFTINYKVEKYRNGSNSAGYSTQMYYSTNGSTWTSAGSDFLTNFAADADNNGFTSAPGATVSISNKVLNQSLAAGSSIYLAWNLSVTSGTTTTNSQALAIDDVSIKGENPPTCTASNLAFTNTTVNKTMADAAFTQTATSLNGTTAITYTSNNTAVATVSETSGQVTLVGAGVAIITATQAAGTHSAVDYCAATATYTLNVASILPTITVTEVTVPAMVALVGNTKTETVNVSGINLTGNLTVSIIDDVDNQFDEPSVTSIAKLVDNTASGTVTVTYRPTASGTHAATLKIESSDATTVTHALSGTATWTPLSTPVATTANPISNSGFTANWDAVVGATDYQLDVYTKTSNPLADLIISEYGEGSNNNKYVEIYNGTGASVDLSNYTLKQSYNGTGWDIDIIYTLPLTGTLANNDVYVISTSDANQTILDQADEKIVYSSSLQGGKIVSFTGNDAIGLFKNGVLIDLFGDPAVTTTVSVAGAAMGDNHTMVRKSNIATGNTNWTTSAGTDATSSEWTVNATDTWTFIGAHNYLGVTKTAVSGSPFTVTSETSKAINGLNAETTYYYTVVAKNTNVASAVSNEITVTTSPTTSIDQLGKKLNLHVSDNRIEFISSANETVAIFNAVGQKLVQKLTVNGLNSIPVSARGVVLVKVGNRFGKVIL